MVDGAAGRVVRHAGRDGLTGFAARFPVLRHVADAAAVEGIRRHGLLCAGALCALHGAVLPDGNRPRYLVVGPGAALRWQGMWDAALATRLASGLDAAGWRRLINGKVFLFARAADARALRRREAGRVQVILQYDTAALLAAGLDLRACRHNNGFIDRSPPGRRRLRGPGDYVPVQDWCGWVPREVTVEHAIPAWVPFRVEAAAP